MTTPIIETSITNCHYHHQNHHQEALSRTLELTRPNSHCTTTAMRVTTILNAGLVATTALATTAAPKVVVRQDVESYTYTLRGTRGSDKDWGSGTFPIDNHFYGINKLMHGVPTYLEITMAGDDLDRAANSCTLKIASRDGDGEEYRLNDTSKVERIRIEGVQTGLVPVYTTTFLIKYLRVPGSIKCE
jgi:hypothetical protein